jgi:hypothetical protein
MEVTNPKVRSKDIHNGMSIIKANEMAFRQAKGQRSMDIIWFLECIGMDNPQVKCQVSRRHGHRGIWLAMDTMLNKEPIKDAILDNVALCKVNNIRDRVKVRSIPNKDKLKINNKLAMHKVDIDTTNAVEEICLVLAGIVSNDHRSNQ